MNRKINTICFIFLFLFLISAVSAVNSENETLQTISQNDADENEIYNVANEEPLQSSNAETEKLEKNAENIVNEIQTAKKKKVNINAPDVTMYFNDGHKLTATLTDENKKGIGNARLKITIGGKTYLATTNTKGIGQLNLHLKSNTFKVTVAYDGSDIYENASTQCNVIIKSTIKCSNLVKYYKNSAAYYSTFYDTNGNVLKNTRVQIKIKDKIYLSTTNSEGVSRLNINLKPGKFTISPINPATTEIVTKTLTVKSLIETKDLTMTYGDGSKFYVKIVDSDGKASPNKKVTIKLDGKTYTKTTNKNGKITLPINLNVGNYTITTKFDDIKSKNNITVNKAITQSDFVHSIKIPTYVNVTVPYVYYYSGYSIKTGTDGILKLPKNQLITIEMNSKTYTFATKQLSGYDAIIIGYRTYLIPFDGSSMRNDTIRNNLKGNGILIYKTGDYIQIDYRDTTCENVELFGFYADKGLDGSETLTYLKNDKITGKINLQIMGYDELGLRYSLSKFFVKNINKLNYNTDIVKDCVKYVNTKEPVEFNIFGNYVVGTPSQENMITLFKINGKEELGKEESISYGLNKNYRRNYGFEVLQSYTIINEKITQKTLEDWIRANSTYINRYGVKNAYAMHLASLETTWIADQLADKYSKEFGVTWNRGNTLTILGGINLKDTYLNILNADMGMTVSGSEKNVIEFRLVNSINLPNIEDYVLSPIGERYVNPTTNSIDNVLMGINENEFSIAQLGELIYVFSKDNSAIILNTTSGVASVIQSKNNSIYKGSSLDTCHDCCSVGMVPQDMINGIKTAIKIFAPGIYTFSDELNKIRPLSVLAYIGIKFVLEHTLEGASSACLGLFSAMALVQTGGTFYRDNVVNENDWYKTMDTMTFTRPGYLQGKKIYNIPNKKGGYDYIEVKINDDLTLDRNNALYLSNGKTKLLTKEETYKYFSEKYWTPFSMPIKYWDASWKEA